MMVINGVDWKFKIVSPNHPMLQRSDGSFTLGSCDNDNKLIYISAILSPEKFKKVLCHEITHAAMFSYKVLLSHEQEELLADLLATYGQEIIDETNKIFIRLLHK